MVCSFLPKLQNKDFYSIQFWQILLNLIAKEPHDSYGNRDSRFGWEVDHINLNGGDNLDNLRPLHWKNNVAKSDGTTEYPVTSSNNDNFGI